MKRFLYVFQSITGVLCLLISVIYYSRIGVFKALPYACLFFILYLPARRLFLKKFPRFLKYGIFLILVLVIMIQEVNPCISGYSKSRCSKCITEMQEMYREKLDGWYELYTEREIETLAGKLHIIQSGSESGKKCILISPLRLGSWSWVYNIDELNENYCVYAIDIMSHSRICSCSNWRKFPRNSASVKEHFDEILEKLGIKEALFIGVSDGANLCLNYAMAAPERVSKLVLISPILAEDALKYKIQMNISECIPLNWITDYVFREYYGDSWIVKTLCRDWFELNQRCSYPGIYSSCLNELKSLKNLEVPCLVIQGSSSGIGSLAKDRGRVKELEIIEIEGKHLLNIEQSGLVNEIFRDNL